MRRDNVGKLQRRLWAAAKQSEARRFHALYDRIYRSDVLWEAWRRVRANKGAAGVDNQTLADVESYGVDRLLTELAVELREGSISSGSEPDGGDPQACRWRTAAGYPDGA